MLPVLVGAGLVAAYLHHRHKKAATPKVGFGCATPARTRQHNYLMRTVYDPSRLENAALVFGSEGLHWHASELANKAANIREQAAVVPDIVTRARTGDQNAMAIIASTRDQAKLGSKRAMVSCALIERFCRANPPTPLAPPPMPEEQPALVPESPPAPAA